MFLLYSLTSEADARCDSLQDVIDEQQHPEGFILEGEVPEAQQQTNSAAAEQEPTAAAGHKRTREADKGLQQQHGDESAEQAAKRHKTVDQQPDGQNAVGKAVGAAAGTVDEPVELISDDEAVICLD